MAEITINSDSNFDNHSMNKAVSKPMNQPMYRHFNQVKQEIQGVEAIDYFFAKEMNTALSMDKMFDQAQQAQLFHLYLALSASLRAGHSCLPLSEMAGQHWGKSFARQNKAKPSNQTKEDLVDGSEDDTLADVSHVGFIFASLSELQSILTKLNIQASDQELLVLRNDKLYLRRYFQFESDLGHAINERLAQVCQFDNNDIEQCISALFPSEKVPNEKVPNEKAPNEQILIDTDTDTASEIDWQKVAVANAINKNFSVIAGGPGTGKTYTVTKLLAALVMLQGKSQQSTLGSHSVSKNSSALNIALVAPTGKAAQRLSESIVSAISGFKGLIADEVLTQIPTNAQTIHRLLGVLPNSPNFKHQEDNRLSYDVVLIDEVSMVDLPLMTRIFRALKADAKVILLGDADQLPSVAAGSVLADIAPRPHSGYSATNAQYLTQVCQLNAGELNYYFQGQSAVTPQVNSINSDYLSFLVKSRRFDGKGGIGLIANSVIQGDVKTSWLLLNDSLVQGDDSQLTLARGELATWLAPLVKQYYQPIESCENVTDAFALLAKFRVLCATRQGDYGVEQLNEVIKSYLGKHNSPFQQNQNVLYHGQPIMINENDYRLGLYNGDIGIVWRVIDQAGKAHLMACFEDSSIEAITLKNGQQGIRQILPSRLPKFESVYAMTIHKTQGSEFAHVAMVISETDNNNKQAKDQRGSKLLSRELLYTGITRAKKLLTIAANQRVWHQGVTAQVKRHSGLYLCEKSEK